MGGSSLPFFSALSLCLFLASLPAPSSAAVLGKQDGSASSSVGSDAEALFQFKKAVRRDPSGVLSGWEMGGGGGGGGSPCDWRGVSCASGRVARLNLSGLALTGSPPFFLLGSLDRLFSVDLSGNSFSLNSTAALLHLPAGLERLVLSSSGVVGALPPGFLSGYPALIHADLSHNNISGPLPEDFFASMPRGLRVLDLSFNNISGSISSLLVGSCTALQDLDLSRNRVAGEMPTSLFNCTNVRSLNLSSNELVGEISPLIGRMRNLERLDLSLNHLSSSIPAALGNACGSLLQLKLSGNNISRGVPESLSSCNLLQLLDLADNNITAPIPTRFFENMTSLERLQLSNNFISGEIPDFSACKNLRIIDFGSNKLGGAVPPSLCPGASSLEELRLPDNSIEGSIPVELSLCHRLRTIDLSINYLSGPIPPELGGLPDLEHLMAWFNGLGGPIPSELGHCSKLKNLILNNNFLSGDIPIELFSCRKLEWISLTSNRITGRLAPEFGRLSRLAVLQMGNNSLSGNLPGELGNCSSLVWLDLNSNRLTGKIPTRLGRQLGAKAPSGILSGNTLAFVRNVGNSCKGVGGLLEFAGIRPERLLQVPTLKSCDFTRLYSGAALSDWTHYQTLEYLDLSYNELQGSIPDEFGDMVVLQVLDVSHNNISGEIPASIGRLRNLGVFDASRNRLEGGIPESFCNLSFLVQIDLSHNRLAGPIPSRGQLSTLPATQYANNPGLCGVPLPPCAQADAGPSVQTPVAYGYGERTGRTAAWPWTNSVVLGILVSVVSVFVLLVWVIAARARRQDAAGMKMLNSLHASHAPTTWKIGREKEPLSINVATFQRQLRKLTFSQLIEATGGFSAASLIGYGGFGEVFKATLKDGSTVAIKKLICLSYQGDREFMAEMETLGKIKHRNLVPLLGYCKVGEERLLVYEYMRYGSLEDMLHGKKRPREHPLSWEERKKIARGAAKGLCFLHHDCIPHIIHRDMKSSNVLLDGEMEARVSDFGMARLISALDTHLSVSTLAGTPGYVPPEYYQSFRCTAKGDVYSFGVVLLELLTGRRPTDKEEFGDTNLVGWAKMLAEEGKGKEMIDPELACGGEDAEQKEMERFLEITLQCVEDFPSKRPNMMQMVAMMRELGPDAAAPPDAAVA